MKGCLKAPVHTSQSACMLPSCTLNAACARLYTVQHPACLMLLESLGQCRNDQVPLILLQVLRFLGQIQGWCPSTAGVGSSSKQHLDHLYWANFSSIHERSFEGLPSATALVVDVPSGFHELIQDDLDQGWVGAQIVIVAPLFREMGHHLEECHGWRIARVLTEVHMYT